MKLKIITLAIVLVLLPFAGAFGAENTSGSTFGGEISTTAAGVDVTGSKAKFGEYSDMANGGLFSDVKLHYDNDNYWMRFRASDIGYDTQKYQLDGGMYGKFKYNFFANDIVHNITSGAKTAYNGVGGNTLTFPDTRYRDAGASTWNTFDYSLKREQIGGGIKVDMLRPFYADVSVTREHRHGLIPWSDDGYEFPQPIHYNTTNVKGEVGYQTRPLFASVSYLFSDFNDDFQTITNQTSGASYIESLPPDNKYYKLAFKGSLRLPLNTRFNVNLSTARGKSDFDLSPLLAANPTSTANSTLFHGRVDTDNYAFTLTSTPVPFLDAKVFYTYYNTSNKSDQIIVTKSGTQYQNYLFDYKKNSYGVDLGFKLPEHFRLNTGYKYIDTDRDERLDIPKTKDNVYSAELKWTGLDFLTPKVAYERLSRRATYGTLDSSVTNGTVAAQTGVDGVDTSSIYRFDATKQNRDTYKAGVDISPLDNLNLGLAYKYKKSDYPDTVLGLKNSKTNEFDFNGDYAIGSIARVSGYYNLQYIKSYMYSINNGTTDTNHPAVVPAPPFSVTDNSYAPSGGKFIYNYPWDLHTKDNTYEFGAATDVYLVPKKLTLRLQYDYVNSDGNLDFSIFNATALAAINAAANNDNIDINNWDDYKKSAFMTKLIYDVNKKLSMTVGAAFDHYKYNDIAYNTNLYNVNSGGATPTPILTGAYFNPSYNANTVFVGATYRF